MFLRLSSLIGVALFALSIPAQQPGKLVPGHEIVHVQPVYPEKAKAHGIQGLVVLRARILTDGTIAHVTVLSGPPELQKAAQDAVYRWRYTPWLRDGQPVEASKNIPVNFSLPAADGKFHPYVAPKGTAIPPPALAALLVRSYPAKLPNEAKRLGVSGPVRLHVTLDETGAIVDLGVLSGPEALEDEALETVRHFAYRPYLLNGKPTAASSEVTVTF